MSGRSKPRCECNSEDLIREISALALSTQSEQIRIQAWTLLTGVTWPTASVFLHFAFGNHYPILDHGRLWSLGFSKPRQYTFPLWYEYTAVCQQLAKEAGVTMRTLDQALLQYSKTHQ
jgi:hypothetical protein